MKESNQNSFSTWIRLGGAALSFAGLALPAQALDVLISGTNPGNDQPLVSFLQNAFEDVTVTYGDYSNYAANAAAIEAADVFVVARSLSSPAYGNLANSASFNALSIPVVCFTSYVARPDGDRWGWHSGAIAATGASVAGSETTVTEEGATAFGVAAGTVDWFSAPAGNNFYALGTGSLGEGEVLATIEGNILAARWDAGEQSGSGAVFGGPRLLFNLPQNGAATVMPTTEGQAALVRALEATTPLEAVQVRFGHFPADGATNVAVDSDIVVTATDVTVDLASLIESVELRINSTLVPGLTWDSSNGVTTFTYSPPADLEFETDHAVELTIHRTDEVVHTVNFSFTTIASGVVSVLVSGTNQVNDQALIDFLVNNFEGVSVTYADFSDYAAHAATIESADVFMVARSLASTAYANAANSASFNALEIPVVAFTSYVTRPLAGRWGWHSGDVAFGAPHFGSDTTITASGASAFGLPEGSYDWIPDTGGNQFNAAGSGSVGDGEILATIGGNILAAHWNAGDLSGDDVTTFGGERFLYNLNQVTNLTVMPIGAGEWFLIKALEAYTPLTMLASLDSDGDGLPDWYEMQIIDSDFDDAVTGLEHVAGPNDATPTDFDGDGLSDAHEFLYSTDPIWADTDGDGLSDGDEISGSLNSYDEFGIFVGVGNGGAPTDPLNSDSDGDGILDGEEVATGENGFVTDPNMIDTDFDGLSDGWEIDNSLDPTDNTGVNGGFGDPDGDDLDNIGEQNAGTDPHNPDTDGDGLDDGLEVNHYFTNPLVADSDGDGLSDGDEVNVHGTNPLNPDTDGDGFSDGAEVAAGSDPNDPDDVPAGLIAVRASIPGITIVDAASDASGLLLSTADFDMNAGNAVALIVTTEFLPGVTSPVSATFAGQPMTGTTAAQTTANGSQVATIFHLINPATTTGAFEVSVNPNLSDIQVAYSQIALSNVPAVAATDTAVSVAQTPAVPMEVSYTTTTNAGFVLGAAVNNDFNNTRQLSIAYGNPNANLLGHTLVGTSGHFHTYGAVSAIGEHTDGYLGQYDRTAIATVVFGAASVGPAGQITVESVGFDDGAFEVTYGNLDTATTYQWQRSTPDLDGFADFGEPVTPASPVQTFSDTEPPAGKAFYRLKFPE